MATPGRSAVARDTSPRVEPSAAETVRAELDAAIDTEGLSRNAGERVVAAIDTDPDVFASASLGQLKAYVGAAVGAGDPLPVGRLVDAAPEAHRAVLTVRARDAFWFQSDLDSWALDALFSKRPRPALAALRGQPYWRRGTILVDSGLDERLRLAQALQIRLELDQAPRELTAVIDLLRDAARPAEAPRFDALRTMGPPAPGQSPSRLAGYQRGLVTWARLEIDPTLDPEDPSSYDTARRLGWYHDRDTVLRFLAQGARLNREETARVVRQVDALSEVQRLRFVGWLLGSQPEADKVGWIRSQGKAEDGTPSLGQRVDAADETQSFLAAFKVSAPAELGKIDDLPSLLLVLDQWDLTARGYVDAMRALRYQQLLREHRLAEQGKPNNRDGFHRSMKLWQSGGPEYVVDFIQQVTRARDRARSAWRTLVGLKRHDGADSVEPNAVTTEVASARGVLGESRALLSKLAPDAKGFVDQIFERDQQAEALRSQATEEAAKSSWLASGLLGAFSAVGSLVDRLKDPGTWKTALEVGLEVAGAAFSGGASVLIKLVHWLVTTGQDLKATIEGAVAKVGILSEPGGFAKLVPLGGLLTSGGLISTAIGALFGDVPPEPQLGSSSTTPRGDGKTSRKDQRTPGQGLIDRVGSLVETVRGAAASVVGPTWKALRSIDITPRAFFQRFARSYYRLIRFREKLVGAGNAAGQFVGGLRARLGEFFDGLKQRLGAAATVFAKPAEAARRWVREITSSGMAYLIGLLITHPPSAILRTTFKAAASLLGTSTSDLGAMLQQKLAGVPLIGDMIAKIESTVEDAVAPLLTKPAEDAFAAGTALFGQAEPLVDGLDDRFGAMLDNTEGFVGSLTGGLWDQVEEPEPKTTTSEATDSEAMPSPESGELTQGKRIQRTKDNDPGRIVYEHVPKKLLLHGTTLHLETIREADASRLKEDPTETRIGLETPLATASARLEQELKARRLAGKDIQIVVLIGGLHLYGKASSVVDFLVELRKLRATLGPDIGPLFDGEGDPSNIFALYLQNDLHTVVEVQGDLGALARRWLFGAYSKALGTDAPQILWAMLPQTSRLVQSLAKPETFQLDNMNKEKADAFKKPALLCYELVLYSGLRTGQMDRDAIQEIQGMYRQLDPKQASTLAKFDTKIWTHLRYEQSLGNVFFETSDPLQPPKREPGYSPRAGQLVFFFEGDELPSHVAISMGGDRILQVEGRTSQTISEVDLWETIDALQATKVTIGDPPVGKSPSSK